MGLIWMTLGALYAVHAVIGMKAAWRPAYLASLGAAAVLVAVGTHQRLAGIGAALAWIGIAVSLFAWGLWWKDSFPRAMGAAALIIAGGRFWITDRIRETAWVPAVTLVAAFYSFSGVLARLRQVGTASGIDADFVAPLAHLGAFALGLAIREYSHDLMVAGLMAASGVVLLIVGRGLSPKILVPEGIVFLMTAGLFMGMNNLDAVGAVAGLSRKLASSIPVLLAWLYVREVFPDGEGEGKAVRGVFAVLLLAGLLALLRCELEAPATPAAWAIVAGAWFLWSKLSRRDAEFLLSAAAATVTVVAFLVTTKLRVPATGWIGPVGTGSIMAGAFLAIHLFSRREGIGKSNSAARDVVAGAMAVTAFAVLAREMTGTWLTGSWAVLGFALAGYGFVVRDRISRWSSLIVLAVCVGKVVLFDLAEFDMPVKIATLLTLGVVMVALSYAYARHHRRIATYLAGRE